MEAALIRKCSEEPEFRAEVLADPKRMLEEALGQKLPEKVSVFIHEEDLHTLHFSVPPSRESLQAELSDEQLEQVAGGTELIGLTALAIVTLSALTSAAVSGMSVVSVVATMKGGHW